MRTEPLELLFLDKNTGWYYILNDSDNYGYDCYSFNEKLELQDGYIPFCADLSCTASKEEAEKEQEFIDNWNEKMTWKDRVNYCLSEMGTSLDNCYQLDDSVLYNTLFDKC